MRRITLLLTILFILSFAGLVNALIMNFDDLEFDYTHSGHLAHYNGFTFSWADVMETDEIPNNAFSNGVVSPDNVLFNEGMTTMGADFGSTFELNNIYLTAAYSLMDHTYIDSINVCIRGLIGNTWTYESVFAINSHTPTQVDFSGWGPITGFLVNTRYDSVDPYYALMDDIDYTPTQAAPVPEPATILLFGSGLIGLAGMGRRKIFSNSRR